LQALLELLHDSHVMLAIISLIDEVVEICNIGVDITPMHPELVQFLVCHELGILVSIGPAKVQAWLLSNVTVQEDLL